MAVVVSDAGPLIALAKTDSPFVLRRLFSEVVVPVAVQRECLRKEGIDSRRIEDAAAEGWLGVVAVQVTDRFPRSLAGVAKTVCVSGNARKTRLLCVAWENRVWLNRRRRPASWPGKLARQGYG